MSTDFEHSLPTPTPLCAIYEPLLPLYVWDELDAYQMAALRAHLESDAYCQMRLAEYQTAIDALRAHVAANGIAPQVDLRLNHHTIGGEAPIHLTLEHIMQASDKPSAPAATSERPTALRQLTPRQRRLTALGAIAAVLVLAVLAASLFSYLGGRSPAHPATPTPYFPNPTPFPTWATAAPSTLKGTVTQFTVPTKGAKPNYIVAGPDGNIWFTESHANKIGRSTPQGSISEFAVPTANAGLTAIAAGPDGNLWFTEAAGNKIGRITPQGSISEFAVPTASAQPLYLALGHDGNIWFTEAAGNKIGRITPQGSVSEFAVPTVNAGLSGITAGVDGNVWFVEYNATMLGRVTPQGTITEFDARFLDPSAPGGATFSSALPNQPVLLARGADGVWWNYGLNGFGYMTPDGRLWVLYGHNWAPNVSGCFVSGGNFWAAPDGVLWYWAGCALERLTLAPVEYVYGLPTFQLFTVPEALDLNSGFVLAPLADGTVWFVGESTDQIGRLT